MRILAGELRELHANGDFLRGWKADLEKVAAHETFVQFLRLYM
jgi:hypothetical protein